MEAEVESPKHEPTPVGPLSSIPTKRAFEDDHSPAVPSPLNPDGRANEQHVLDEASASRVKSSRAKKDSFKKRESKGGESGRATPDPKPVTREPREGDSGPLRYTLPPPKESDFELPRGAVLTLHHGVVGANGEETNFFETSDK